MNSESKNDVRGSLTSWGSDCSHAWDGFWFHPRDPFVLGIIRALVGCIVFYTHAVWTFELSTFLGPDGVLPPEFREMVWGNAFAWSHLDWFAGSMTALLIVHVVGLVVIAMFALGWWTRWTSILTAMSVISYANRATGALFGLDQINAFLCLYLAVGNSGGAFSLDRLLAKKREGNLSEPAPDTLTNIGTRLIQIHMCVVYFFAAVGKFGGETWFAGEAVWDALASYEYQTIDMTWLADHMWLVAIMTLTALAWELSYAALIWPRLTRPIMLAIAIPVHLGIGMCMGMMTFGLIMLAGNLAFIESEWLRRFLKTK
ncbi:MAG: HTTM domain-containing protein [Mariniblastus sp.]